MPYQQNYAEDISDIVSGKRIVEKSIFRFATPYERLPEYDDKGGLVFAGEKNPLIAAVIGEGAIELNENREFVELHFYSRDDNRLVKSVAIPFSEGFMYIRDSESRRQDVALGGEFMETIQFGLEFWDSNKAPEDNLYSKYLKDVPPGFYNVIVNFFADELGTYTDFNWKIAAISNSRRELILEPLDNSKVDPLNEVGQFADQSIFHNDFKEDLQYVFERQRVDTSDPPYKNIINYFFDILKDADIETYNYIFAQDRKYRDQVLKTLRKILADSYGDLVGMPRKSPDGPKVPNNWVKREVSGKRHRITNKNFDGALLQILFDNISAHLKDFPTRDGKNVFFNR